MAAAEGSENYDRDEIEIPPWLDEQFLTEVLKSHHKDNDLKVVQTTFSSATKKGDNFLSILFRAKVEYQLRSTPLTMSLIIKTMPETDNLEERTLNESLCSKEVLVYTKIIPKFEKILRDAGDETVFAPKCIYHTLTPKQVIVLEDLCMQGFELIRGRFVSFDEAKACYEKMAKWHALGYKILIEEPDVFHEFRYEWFGGENEGLDVFIELLGNVPTLSKYKPFFETLRPLKLTKVREIFELYNQEPRPAGCYTLNHGDFHSRNVMFKSAAEPMPHCRLLDFQHSCLETPVMDILCTLYILVDAEVRHHKRDELIFHYHKIFVETLEKTAFNGTVPSLDDLKKQIHQHRHSELFLLYAYRPNVLECVAGKFEDFGETEALHNAYYNQAFIDELHITLPKLEKLGLFAIDSD